MWKDDRHWFHLLFSGSKFRGFARFRGQTEMLEHGFFACDTLDGVPDLEKHDYFDLLMKPDDAIKDST
jgi:hypothetical protein